MPLKVLAIGMTCLWFAAPLLMSKTKTYSFEAAGINFPFESKFRL